MLFGALIGLLIVLWIIMMNTWFPRIGEAWARHNRLVQSTLFTAGLFGTLIIQFWDRRHRGSFWASMCAFLLLHVSGVVYYSTRIHPLVLQQWMILLALECLVVFVSLDLLMKLFARLSRHRQHRVGARS